MIFTVSVSVEESDPEDPEVEQPPRARSDANATPTVRVFR
jgi:hypothetical protein